MPEIAALRYIMRMDTDSLILSPWKADPFAQMRAKRAVYGYKCVVPDFPPFVKGVLPFVEAYIKSNSLTPKFPGFAAWVKSSVGDNTSLVPMPYTNMELMDVRLCRQERPS